MTPSHRCSALSVKLFLILVFSSCPLASFAQELPPEFVLRNVASGAKFDLPVGIALAPDNRIFVAEKEGRVYVVHNGEKIAQPFIDLENEVLSQHDQGLLGIAVDPHFDENRWVYLLYVVDPTGGKDNDAHAFSRLTRYRARQDNLNEANQGSRQILLGNDWRDGFIACSDQHVIGSLRFAQDGTLLVSAGEAGVPGIADAGGHHPECFADGRFDPAEDIGSFRSQYLGSLAGKVLRIDPETGDGLASNPYFTGRATDNQSRIWAYGLRNPFRFSVRPNGSNDPADGRPGSVYIGDVGWNQYEDLNVSKNGGENFGWPCYEGPERVRQYGREGPKHSACFTIGSEDNPAPHTLPLMYWHHTDPNKSQPNGLIGSSVTGGAFYLGNSYPVEYRGGYFFADFVEGWLKVLQVDGEDNLQRILDFATFPGGYFEHGIVDIQSHPVNGDMHLLDITAGEILKIVYTGQAENQEPIALAEADTLWGYAPLTVGFSGSESYDPDGEPLVYGWEFGTGDSSSAADPVYVFNAAGQYSVKLTVTDPHGAKSAFVVGITVGSVPPVAKILSPEEGISVYTDQRIILQGEGSDPDEPESNLSYEWVVDLHHNTHVHPSSLVLEGKVASLVPGNHGDPWDIIYLEAKLKVTDSSNLVTSAKRYIVLKIRGEEDITDRGTPVALVSEPTGDGSKDIEVIRDGVFPEPDSQNPGQQYDTFAGGGFRNEDWIGYEFSETHRFSKVIFQEGLQFPDGGWFEALIVQIRQDGVWKDGFFFNSIPPYKGGNGLSYETYTLLFTPESGDGIRIKGLPGGSSHYISVAELRVVETPFQPPPAAKLVLLPTDDARTRSSRADFNYGTSTEMRLRLASGVQQGYLKFSISGLVGEITSAKLRLYTNDGGPDGGTLYQVSNNLRDSNQPWDEVELNYLNAPVIEGTTLGAAGAVEAGNWVEFDVGSVVLGNGVYSFGLKNASDDMVEYSTKEGAHAPELVIERNIVETSPPQISFFKPATGAVGTAVTIHGQYFIGYTGVLFSGVPADIVTLDSDDQLRALVPANASTGRISVVSPAGVAVTTGDFVVTGEDSNETDLSPQIAAFVPAEGSVGTLVTVSGRNFEETTRVSFDSLQAEFSVQSDTSLTATVPQVAHTGPIYVYNDHGVATSESEFVVLNPPLIFEFSPPGSRVGEEVTIDGAHLSATIRVMFDSLAADFSVETDSLLRAVVPLNARTGKIAVATSAGLAVSKDDFRVQAGPSRVPEVLGFSPAKGPVGTAVRIVGVNFTSASEVKFEEMAVPAFDVESDTVLVAYVPEGAESGKIAVSNDLGTGVSLADFVVDLATGVAGPTADRLPRTISLKSNYPNPFNLETTIEYGLPRAMHATVAIYNLKGQLVRRLISATLAAGFGTLSWDGRDHGGQVVGSGIYFVLLKTDHNLISKKITLQK